MLCFCWNPAVVVVLAVAKISAAANVPALAIVLALVVVLLLIKHLDYRTPTIGPIILSVIGLIGLRN